MSTNQQAIPAVRRAFQKYPDPLEPQPGLDELEEYVLDGICPATDGCDVEPDGVCPHGHPSWLIALGMI